MARDLPALLRSPWPRLGLFVLLLAAAGWLTLTEGQDTVAAVRGFADRHSVLGGIVYVLVYAAGAVMFFPTSVLSAVAGLVFQPVLGVLLVLTGALLGASAAFLLGRVLSRPAVRRLAGGRIDRLDALLARYGLLAVLLVRLIPLFPFGLVNYGAAVSAIGFWPYLVGTGFGILPATVAFVTAGGALTDPGSPAFLISVGALLVLAGGGALVARWLRRSGRY